MKPACVKCGRFYRPKRNGTLFIESMPKHNGAKPGVENAAEWQPYKLWVGDLWICNGCGSEIIVGVCQQPISEHFEKGEFADKLRQLTPEITINDC